MKPQYITIKDFAEIFCVTPAAVHKWVLQRKIEAIQLEGTDLWRIPISEIEDYKKRSRIKTNKDVFERNF
jgi:hypothetical protein